MRELRNKFKKIHNKQCGLEFEGKHTIVHTRKGANVGELKQKISLEGKVVD